MKINYPRIGLFFLLLTGFLACKNDPSTAENEITAPIKVKTALVRRQSIEEYQIYNGVTRYQKNEDIRANVTGYVSWMPFERGDKIRKGQVFATIRTKEQDALKEAVEIDSSLAKFSKPMRVTSNSTGILSQLNVVANDYVAEGDVLATVSQPHTLEIQVSIPFEKTKNIKVGTPCSIIVQGHPEIDARISSKLTSIDSLGQAQHYLISLSGQELPENLNVQVKILSKKVENALTIPHEALQTNELLTNFWVIKIVNDSLAVKKKVRPLIQTDSLIQIESDEVKENDMVITQGSYQMQDSTKVSVQN